MRCDGHQVGEAKQRAGQRHKQESTHNAGAEHQALLALTIDHGLCGTLCGMTYDYLHPNVSQCPSQPQ